MFVRMFLIRGKSSNIFLPNQSLQVTQERDEMNPNSYFGLRPCALELDVQQEKEIFISKGIIHSFWQTHHGK